MNLRVLLIDHERGRAAILEHALIDSGYEVVARVAMHDDLLHKVEEVEPDIVIVDMKSPDRNILETIRSFNYVQPRPIVIFAEKSDQVTIAEAVKAGVSAYVVDGFAPNRLNPIIEAAIARFHEFQSLRSELEDTKNKLQDRKQIDKAKGILMKQKGVSEEEAYQALRKMAMDKNLKIIDVSRNVISVAELLN